MSNKFIRAGLVSLIVLIVGGGILWGLLSQPAKSIHFFCGSGMKIPAQEIIENFSGEYGIKVLASYEGSGILRRNIETFHEADVFLSGDKGNVEKLDKLNLVEKSGFMAWHIPSILVPKKENKINGLSDLAKPDVKFIMSNPKQASLGKMVDRVMQKHPLKDQLFKNIAVYGASTQEDLILFHQYQKEGKAQAVIEWDVMACTPEGKGLKSVPIEPKYAVREPLTLALLRNRSSVAQEFYKYFLTEGRKVFSKYCYNVEEKYDFNQ